MKQLSALVLVVLATRTAADDTPFDSLISFLNEPAGSQAVASASRFSDLYDDATLKKWQPAFEEDAVWNYKNAILPRLTKEERQRLANTTLHFPLRSVQGGVFDFYAADGQVYLPVQSIRFLFDLLLATAWLDRNGYTSETVQQYVGMLRFADRSEMPRGRYPRPLESLGVPDNARDDERVMKTFNNIGNSAIIFILCHELGHVVHRHPGYIGVDTAAARKNEAEADRFALDVMRRVGVLPAGVMFWFVNATRFDQHRPDVASDEEWKQVLAARTHPLTSDRLENIATTMAEVAPDFGRTEANPAAAAQLVRTMANQISFIAATLTNEGIHRLYRHQAITTKPDMLKPRRTLAYTAGQDSAENFDDVPFSGVFDCTFNSKISGQSIGLNLVLRRNGTKVTGEYSYGVSSGRVSGSLEGDGMNFSWFEGPSSGKGLFAWNAAEKSFTGTWGDGTSGDNGGAWNGRRK